MRIHPSLALSLVLPSLAVAQGRSRRPRPAAPAAVAAPAATTPGPLVTAARYRVRIDPQADMFEVRAEFDLAAPQDTVLLSLPEWSPGSYDVDNYARWVHNVRAEADGRPAFWDKVDKDTWRLVAGGARHVALEFRTNPDSQMLQFSEIEPDFAFFNGTNLFVYPEGTNFQFPAEVMIGVPTSWTIATGLDEVARGTPGRYRADNYHDLVDAPVFAGALRVDSVIVDGKPIRFAIYPDSAMSPAVWDSVRATISGVAQAQNRIFGGAPYASYTILFYAPFQEMSWGGGLEHHNSQLDAIAAPFFATNRATGQLGDFTRPLLSHEFFHLWNVKRIRPADMWPYDYSREQYTPLLWWSEGVTDYYGDVSLTRGGLWSPERFLQSLIGNIRQVEDAQEIVAAEDASIDTWIHPTFVDEAQYYYPKGSLLGLMLDIRIREATGNQKSLDDVMRALWTDYYQKGHGFTTRDLLGIIRPWFTGVDEFYQKYIRGRELLPYVDGLSRAGIAVNVQEVRTPRLGLAFSDAREGGLVVGRVEPNSLASQAGLQAGDILMKAGDVPTSDPSNFGIQYRTRYAGADGTSIRLEWLRGGQPMTGRGTVRLVTERAYNVARDPGAAPAAKAILDGILGQR
jgi:predicted metalloprotease with PDZ domain